MAQSSTAGRRRLGTAAEQAAGTNRASGLMLYVWQRMLGSSPALIRACQTALTAFSLLMPSHAASATALFIVQCCIPNCPIPCIWNVLGYKFNWINCSRDRAVHSLLLCSYSVTVQHPCRCQSSPA